MANDNQNFDDTFIGRENRKSNYRTWSERAVVVGFNAESQTYDIVITTEKTLGNNIRTLNRVIRQVRASIEPQIRTFLPGESIIVGYVDDRREHPIIVGLGDSSDHNCVKVTLGISSTIGPTIEGITAPSLADPVFTRTPCTSGDFLEDSLTGSTTTLTLDCSSLDITGCFEAEVEAPSGCGCGVYDWSLSGGLAGFTISNDGALAQAVGTTITIAPLNDAGSRIKICPPTNSGGFPGVTAFHHFNWHQCTPSGSNKVSWGEFDCDGDEIQCRDLLQNGPNYNASTCAPCLLSPCNAGSGHPDTMPAIFHGDCPLPTICPTALFDFVICDSRSQAMLDANCTPCRLMMSKSILTAEDACGKMLSIEIQVEP